VTAVAPACPAICCRSRKRPKPATVVEAGYRRRQSTFGPRQDTLQRASSSFVPGELHNPAAMKLIIHVDGGARGNPGPAAAACVLSTPSGEVVDEQAELLGKVTNNVAEYRALLLGLARARELGATEVDVVGDSELIAKQVKGLYKVKHPSMRPLYMEAMEALKNFQKWSIRTVPRAQNAEADALVNAALDQAAAASR
jgi:ribonuclease HI